MSHAKAVMRARAWAASWTIVRGHAQPLGRPPHLWPGRAAPVPTAAAGPGTARPASLTGLAPLDTLIPKLCAQ